jgi:hypothetical protein
MYEGDKRSFASFPEGAPVRDFIAQQPIFCIPVPSIAFIAQWRHTVTYELQVGMKFRNAIIAIDQIAGRYQMTVSLKRRPEKKRP